MPWSFTYSYNDAAQGPIRPTSACAALLPDASYWLYSYDTLARWRRQAVLGGQHPRQQYEYFYDDIGIGSWCEWGAMKWGIASGLQLHRDMLNNY